MTTEGRIRISLAAGELEIEGTTDFVKLYDEAISDMLERLASQPLPTQAAGGPIDTGQSDVEDVANAGTTSTVKTVEFGEALHGLPKTATGTDRILAAAYFAQNASGDNTFTTGLANKLLIEQGVKLANAAQCVKQNATAKRVFKVAGNKWRISQTGLEHLRTLNIA